MLKKLFVTALLTLTATVSFNSMAASGFGYAEGSEYQKIPKQQNITPHQKKVVEVFYYGCPHCYHLEESLHEWQKTKPKSVHFEQMPAVLDNPNWVFMARVFYTAKFLKILEPFHQRYFEAIQRDRKQIYSLDALAKFAEPMGVKQADYKAMFKSFQVSSAVSKAKQKTAEYGINGVPAVVVNGKYITDVPMASSRKELWKVVNHLTNK